MALASKKKLSANTLRRLINKSIDVVNLPLVFSILICFNKHQTIAKERNESSAL